MRSIAWCLALVTLGCGGGVTNDGDAGDATRPDPDARDPPAPPRIAPCPDGWRELTSASGVVTCEPWPEGGERTDCPIGEGHLPGTPGCAPLGAACPADGWPAGLPADRPVVYVDDGAAAGGDGTSRARALRSIAAAMASAPAGAIVAVAEGTYDEAVAVRAGRTLWGACASGTRLVSSAADEGAALLALAEDRASASNIAVVVSARPGIVVSAEGASLDGVVVSGARLVGVSVTSGSLSARRLAVLDTVSGTGGTYGNGISVASGTTLSIEQAILLRNRNGALAAAGGTVTGRAIVASDTLPLESDERFGHGVAALAGASVTLEEAVLERNHAEAAYAGDASTSLTLRRSVLRDTLAQTRDDAFGRGLDALGSAHAVLERSLVSGNHTGGLFAAGAGTALTATDVVVTHTLAQPSDARAGIGAHVDGGATLTLERVHVEDSLTLGVLATGAGAALGATDLRVTGVGAQESDGRFGRGLQARMGAQATLTRAAFEATHECGLSAIDAGTSVDATHLAVSNVSPGASDAWGVGIAAEQGASMTLSILRVESVRLFGIRAHTGASVVLTHVTVDDVSPSACATSSCAALPGAFGLLAQGGSMRATRFLVASAGACGALVEGMTGSLDLTDGRIEDTSTGACIQSSGYDGTRLTASLDTRRVGARVMQSAQALPLALPLY
ncbi:MAG: hypothetical protein IT378_06485 [Sandaracinaceae bacterium]|nr:hypothetical protein [Sandaracinaceae bacterium]